MSLRIGMAIALLALGCGSKVTTQSGDGGGGNNDGTASSDDGGGGGCPACLPSQGCVNVRVTRAASDANLPWKVWPTEADGVGTLVVSVLDGVTVLDRSATINADLRSASALVVARLCVPEGTHDVRGFLDDNVNAPSDAFQSSDYRDACHSRNSRKEPVTAVANQTVIVDYDLDGSCD